MQSPPPEKEDPLDGLEDRLKSHALAFESLLALTPARDYYGSQIVDGHDPSEQWKRKKQTKEEKRAARKAKLDPKNMKSALDVVREREAEALKRKRKREVEENHGENDKVDGEDEDVGKRQKGADDADAAEARKREIRGRKREKRAMKKERKAAKKEKAEAKKARKQERDLAEAQAEKQDVETKMDAVERPADVDAMDTSGLADDKQEADANELDNAASEDSSAPTTPMVDSPAFDLATNQSEISSPSSIVPPSVNDQPPRPKQPQPEQPSQTPTIDTATPTSAQPTKPTDSGIASPKLNLPKIPHAEAQERLRARIEALRAQRKADGPDGTAAKSRQELLDQRRKKEELRKAAKKAQRQKDKEDEARRREEQLRGSGSPRVVEDIFSPRHRSPEKEATQYSFSRLAFEDGTAADPSLSHLQDPKRKKGPQDPATALRAAQTKQARLAGYDPAKRAEIDEKDVWLNAKKRVQGERVRDDTSLLKKALKRKEKMKGKSEERWREREEGVVRAREGRQKKREGNLQKRREEKGGKGKKGGKQGGKKGGGGGKKKGRPGFEGRFKA